MVRPLTPKVAMVAIPVTSKSLVVVRPVTSRVPMVATPTLRLSIVTPPMKLDIPKTSSVVLG